MKNYHRLTGLFCMIALIFTSCSKEEANPVNKEDLATLSFTAIVNDLAKKSNDKQSIGEIPSCSDATAAYVEIVLSQDGADVVGSSESPFRIDLVAGQIFTEEVSELELAPGDYSLDHFMVFDADGNLLWIAPTGGPMADFVDSTLPMDISLGAGVKKYVDVSVLCYDDRDVNEYGYLFFEIDTNRAIKFCIFGNYCDPTGRHFTASYSVNVWSYADGVIGDQLYDEEKNSVAIDENGDMAAAPLCLILPDNDGLDEYYFEITLLDGDDYDMTPTIIRSGVVNDDEVRSLFVGEDRLDYYHFRSGCDNDDNIPILQDPEDEAEHYKACLYSLNDSEVVGLAYFSLEGNVLSSTVIAYNMEGNMVHPQHIHGFADDRNSTCPSDDADTDGDGIVSLEEGAPFYGGVMLSLTKEDDQFPMANAAGMLIYNRTFTLGGGIISSADLLPLENRAVVLHGAYVDGEYAATLPVACGQVAKRD